MTRTLFLLAGIPILAATLSGCGIARSLSQPFKQPTGGEIAMIRIVTNGTVRFIPNQSCVSWDNAEAGVVAAAEPQRLKNNHNGEKIGMKPAPLKDDFGMKSKSQELGAINVAEAEVRVAANKPLTIVFSSESYTSDWAYWCDPISVAFIPEAGREYEVRGWMGEQCMLRAQTLGSKTTYPAQRRAKACE